MKIKKIFCIVILLICSNLSWMKVYAQEINIENIVKGSPINGENEMVSNGANEDYQYRELEDGTLEITEYTGSDTELVIPSKIDGKRVSSIGVDAFFYNNSSSLESVTIPGSITSIGCYTFLSF